MFLCVFYIYKIYNIHTLYLDKFNEDARINFTNFQKARENGKCQKLIFVRDIPDPCF